MLLESVVCTDSVDSCRGVTHALQLLLIAFFVVSHLRMKRRGMSLGTAHCMQEISYVNIGYHYLLQDAARLQC